MEVVELIAGYSAHFLFNFILPFAVLRDLGMCFDMSSVVMPGQVAKIQLGLPLLM